MNCRLERMENNLVTLAHHIETITKNTLKFKSRKK